RELVEARRFGQVLPHAQPLLVVHAEIILGGSIAPVGARFQILLDRCGVATAGSLGHFRNRPDRARYRNEDRQAKTAKQRCALFICRRRASHALRESSNRSPARETIETATTSFLAIPTSSATCSRMPSPAPPSCPRCRCAGRPAGTIRRDARGSDGR